MLNSFTKNLNDLYNIILQPIDIMHKITAINNFKIKFNIERTQNLGNYYCKIMKDNKGKGVVYTPEEIAQYIVENTITKEDIINNPYIKIVDPACGSGNLLICLYKHLFNLYEKNLAMINYKNNLKLNISDIPFHIINENIFGFDIDETAIKILIIDLFNSSNHYSIKNICKEDFLLLSTDKTIDIFIGNPPYIGHKSINNDYSIVLKEMYKNTYRDKGDISYCFFEKALNLMSTNGKLSFITSRYFLESPSGEGIRNLLNNYEIYRIIDFYGIRPFKNIGIDPVIIFLCKKKKLEGNIEVIKPAKSTGKDKKQFIDEICNNNISDINKFYIKKEQLRNDRWILKNSEQMKIVRKIEEKCKLYLGDVCETFQGIITGCDKAFIVNDDIINKYALETHVIKPWIKSSYIQKKSVIRNNTYIIYSNLINNENECPNNIEYIKKYKDKLINRRECKKGFRKWYELQWGRNQSIFKNEKIIFPYKSNCNRFALDKGSYYSADVYSLIIKDNNAFTYEFVLFLLNSSIYEFYFKSFAKKLGEDLYEYYPNTLLKLKIPSPRDISELSEEALLNFLNLTSKEKDIIHNCI